MNLLQGMIEMKALLSLACQFLISSMLYSQVQVQPIASRAAFRGLCAVSEHVAWVSGTKGTVARTVDGGKNWNIVAIPDSNKLDFRDIEAFDENRAYVLSIGPGENSRIYKTVDGGKQWKMQFKNTDPDAFYDAIAFWDADHGIALSDPVKGYFRLLRTKDGGESWTPLPIDQMPQALPGEGAFAASGTCLITRGANDAWFVTGGGATARVYHTMDRGQSWKAYETPLLAGKPSAGIFSIVFKDQDHGMIVGGDYQQPNDQVKTHAFTANGGKTWKPGSQPLPFRSGIAWSHGQWLAAGTSGISRAKNEKSEWEQLDQGNYNAISISKSGHVWSAGPDGKIATWKLP